MKTLQKTLLALAAGSLLTAGAQAAITYGNGMTAQPYIGVKVGQYDPDESGVDEATSYGVYGGAKFTPNFGAELEYMTTGDADIDTNVGSSEYSADVYGLYGTYEYMIPSSPVYAKARLGFAKNKVDIETTVASQTGSSSVSESGIAGGIGLGYNMTPNAGVELSYEWYPTIEGDNVGDTDVSGLTLGANFKF